MWTADRALASEIGNNSLVVAAQMLEHSPLRNLPALAAMDSMSVGSCRFLLTTGVIGFLQLRAARCFRSLAFDVAGSWENDDSEDSEDQPVQSLLKKGDEFSVGSLVGTAA